jgi:hypothetical protein
MARRGTALFFSEVGVGGGSDAWGGSRTTDPRAAAAAPFYGVTQPYQPHADPWHADGPASPMASFLKSFYSALARFAAARGTCPRCKWAIDGVFLWNCGSWDVQGVHPSSWAGDDPARAAEAAGPGRPTSYRDPAVVSMIVAHNQAAAGGGGRGGGAGRQSVVPASPHEGEEAQQPTGVVGPLPAPAAATSSRAAVFAEAARLAAAMMAGGGGGEAAVEAVTVVDEPGPPGANAAAAARTALASASSVAAVRAATRPGPGGDAKRTARKKLSEHEKALREMTCVACKAVLSQPLSTPCGEQKRFWQRCL